MALQLVLLLASSVAAAPDGFDGTDDLAALRDDPIAGHSLRYLDSSTWRASTSGSSFYSAPSYHTAATGAGFDVANCTLDVACTSGVASTISYFLTKASLPCEAAWEQAVAANDGPGSLHHTCPASAGTGHDAWRRPVWANCVVQVIASARRRELASCEPHAPPLPPPPPPLGADSFPARVPGDIISDLAAAGRVGDVLYELNFKNSSRWMLDWNYTLEFGWEPGVNGEEVGAVLLVFEGCDQPIMTL